MLSNLFVEAQALHFCHWSRFRTGAEPPQAVAASLAALGALLLELAADMNEVGDGETRV